MGTIAEKLTYTYNAIERIEDALRDKGCNLDDIPLKEYWRYILALKTTDLFFEELSAIKFTYYKIKTEFVDDIIVNENDINELSSKTVLNTQITQLDKPTSQDICITDDGNIFQDNFVLGQVYHFAGYDWTCAEKIQDGYVLQSHGITYGKLGDFLVSIGYSKKNFTGIDIHTYNEDMTNLYDTIKDTEAFTTYGQGLYLAGSVKTGTERIESITVEHGYYRYAYMNAAEKSANLGYNNLAYTGDDRSTSNQYMFYCIKDHGSFDYTTGDWWGALAPAFNIDKSKVTIDNDNNITIIGE